jgi:PAS domain S-box-containing protein
MSTPLRVLLIEDSEADAALLVRELERRGFEIQFERVDAAPALRAVLERQPWDLVLLDYALPQFDPCAALEILRASGQDPACVVVSGTVSEEAVVTLLQAGAHDFVSKQNLARLSPAVGRALREANLRAQHRRIQAALRESQERYHDLVENAHDLVQVVAADGSLLYVNRAWHKALGYADEVVAALSMLQVVHPDCREHCQRLFEQVLAGQTVPPFEATLLAKDGHAVLVEGNATRQSVAGRPAAVCCLLRDVTERRRMERALAVERNLLRAVIDHLPDYIYAKDRQARYTLCNRALAQLIGAASPEAVLGKTAPECFPGEVGQQFYADDLTVLETGQPVTNAEHRHELPEGTVSWQLTTKVPLRDDRGQVISLVGIGRDITERRRGEEWLRKLTRALEQTADHVLITNRDGVIEYVNPAFEEATGYTRAEVLGQTPRILKSGHHSRAFYETLWRVILNGKVFRAEFINRRKNGSEYFEEKIIAPIRDASGAVTHFVATGRDVTERHEAERLLRLAEEQYRTLAEAAQDIIYIVDPRGRIQYVNQFAAQFAGRTAAQLTGCHLRDLFPAATVAAQLNDIEAVLALGQPVYRERQHTFGERRVWVGTRFVPITHPATREQVVLGLGRDLTEQKRLEEQVRHMQKLDAVGQLAGGVAHDFNNVLTVIQGFAQLLLTDQTLGPAHREPLGQIAAAAQKAGQLTRQLLTFSRKQAMEPVCVDLNQLVHGITRMLQRLLGEHITLQVHPAERPALVHADEGMLEQVVVNLAVNARDAMPRGGRLEVSTAVVQVEPAYVAEHPEARVGEFTCLSVADTGCGMTPEVRARLFEPFFTTKPSGRGTGLGLATVYGIVTQHQGWIEVQSEIGAGAIFRVFLPAVPRTDTQLLRQAAEHEIPHGTETVLIVEDEDLVRVLTRTMLERCGYQVLEARSAPEALGLWKQYGPRVDLLLTDILLSKGETGRELAERLRGSKPGLKVAFVSGYNLDALDPGLESTLGRFYLQKPYTSRELAQLVRKCLDERPSDPAGTHGGNAAERG